MIPNNSAEDLNTLAEKLIQPADFFSVSGTLDHINSVLSYGVSDSDRQTAIRILRSGAREAALSDIETLMGLYPKEFPDYVLALDNQLPILLGKRHYPECGEEDFNLPKDLWPLFNSISECKTPDSVNAFVSKLSNFLEQHSEFREAGFIRLISAVKDELLAAYLDIFEKLPEHTDAKVYIVGLLTSVEEMYHYNYPLEWLYYGRRGFETVTPTNLIMENEPNELHSKLKITCDAIADMLPEGVDELADHLKDSLSHAILHSMIQDFGGEAALPDSIRFCLARLSEIEEGVLATARHEEAPEDVDSLRSLLAAQNMLHALSTHEDTETLACDWEEFLNCVADCWYCSDLLENRACEVLTVRILTYLMMNGQACNFKISASLIRLFVALSFSVTRTTYQQEVTDWIRNGDEN